jgi:PilZ domain
MIERRRYHRVPTHKAAKIVFNYNSVIDCTIRDLSDAGARLELPAAAAIPQTFDLITDDPDGAHLCQVIWRSQDNVGVSFE